MKSTNPTRRRVRMAALGLLFGAACTGPEAPDTFTVADSAGVALATNAAGATAPLWRLSDRPLVVLGDETTGDTPLYGVYSVRLGSDGRIVLAHGGAKEVRTYGQDGAFLWAAGGPGQGPGEFRFVSQVSLLPGDSVVALDPSNERMTVFDPDGSFVSTTRFVYEHIRPEGNILYRPVLAPLGTTSSHLTFALVRMMAFLQNAPGRRTQRGVLSVFDPGGEGGDSLGSLPIADLWEEPGSEQGILNIAFVSVLRPFVANDLLYAAEGGTWDVGVYESSGRKVREIRDLHPRVAVTQAMVDSLPPLPAGMKRTDHIPDSLPAIGKVVADGDGRIWAVAYRASDGNPTTARVYDGEGRLVGLVGIPGGFELQDVRDNRVVGVQKDEMDVETVVVYALNREGS